MPKEKFVLTLDSSQIVAFLDCPWLWKLGYYERLEPNSRSANVPMDMGTYGHKLLEIIYKARAAGAAEKIALDAAMSYDIDKETCRCSHGHEKHHQEPFTNRSCMSIGCPCPQFDPIKFPLEMPDRAFVQERVHQYTMMEGSIIPELIPKSPNHVEVGFSQKIYEDDLRLYILEGRIDLLGKIASNFDDGWADHKFQMRERDLYLKSVQFRNYAFVTQLSIGVVNYIRFAKKIEKDKTFKRAIISFSRSEMTAWESELIAIFHRVHRFLDGNVMGERHNWSACSGKYGYPCDFASNTHENRQGICEAHVGSPGLVEIIKTTDYKKKAEWRPW